MEKRSRDQSLRDPGGVQGPSPVEIPPLDALGLQHFQELFTDAKEDLYVLLCTC